MRHPIRAASIVAALCLAVATASPALAQGAPAPAAPGIAPVAALGALPAPALAAAAYVLVDTTSGQTLAAINADERRDPASLTKLMTAYVVFGALRGKAIVPSQMVNVSEKAWRAEGSRMFIEPRKAVSVDELLRGMIVQSGNDASIALAELVGGTEEAFVARMNTEAARLGMANTRFANVTGLSAPQHYATAADLALGVAAAAWLAERVGGTVVADGEPETPGGLRTRCDAAWAEAREAVGLDHLLQQRALYRRQVAQRCRDHPGEGQAQPDEHALQRDGAGIGLWLTRAAVERAGGRLYLHNTATGGRATIELPLRSQPGGVDTSLGRLA